MENLILVIVLIVFAAFVWNKLASFFSRKNKKSKPIVSKPNSNDPREKAISDLMNKLQKAKLNQPEIIEQNPELAAKVLKLWVKKDQKK